MQKMNKTNINVGTYPKEKRKVIINYEDDSPMLEIIAMNVQKRMIKDKMNQIIYNIKKLTKVSDLPSVSIEIQKTNNENIDISDSICRVIFYNDNTYTVHLEESPTVSHFVESTYSETIINEWQPSDNFAKKCFHSVDDAIKIIIDVMLDIIVFHWKFHEENHSLSKRDFSLEKVKFYDIALHKAGVKYVSFAEKFFVENIEGLELYLNYWNKFIDYINSKKIIGNSTVDNCSAYEILSKYKGAGQVSTRKFQKLIDNRNNGQYILVRTIRKPKSVKLRKKILCLFGKRKWRNGLIKVVEEKHKITYLKYNKYVDCFFFEL